MPVVRLNNHKFPPGGASLATFFENIPAARTPTSLVKEALGMVQSPAEQDRPPAWAWKRRMAARWEKMTPEERERFRAGWGDCGHWRQPQEAERKA